MNTKKIKKGLLLSLPYVILGLICTNIGEAWRLAEGADYSKKLVSFFSMDTEFPSIGSLHRCDLRRWFTACRVSSRQECQALYPAYHMNKENWISIDLGGPASEAEIRHLLEQSYQLTG